MRYLRRLYKLRWQQHVPNREVLERAELRAVSEDVRRRRWNWVGHVMRIRHDDDCAVALDWRADGKRNSGRPKKRGGEWWRKNENASNGQIGVMSGALLKTGLDGRMPLKPYMPHGTKRFKVKVRLFDLLMKVGLEYHKITSINLILKFHEDSRLSNKCAATHQDIG